MRLILLLLVGCWTGVEPPVKEPAVPVQWKAVDTCKQATNELWQQIDTPLVPNMCEPADPDYWWCAFNELMIKFDDLYRAAYRSAIQCD